MIRMDQRTAGYEHGVDSRDRLGNVRPDLVLVALAGVLVVAERQPFEPRSEALARLPILPSAALHRCARAREPRPAIPVPGRLVGSRITREDRDFSRIGEAFEDRG